MSSPLIAFSLDDLQPLVLDLYDRMQRDWAATAYWGGVWVCGFIATFLLLRMLFTRWGDRDVMKKTLGLSLIVHMLFGMLSTTVIFGPGMSSEGDAYAKAIRVVVAENTASGREGTAGEDANVENDGGSRTGRQRAWEQVPKFTTEPSGRLQQPSREAAGGAMEPQERSVASEPLAFPANDLVDRPEQTEPAPAPDRAISKLNRPAERAPTSIAEETADARPEANARPNGPGREARGAAESSPPSAADVTRRTRPAPTSGAPAAVDFGPDLVESAKTGEPRPLIARSGETQGPTRLPRGTPNSTVPNDDGGGGGGGDAKSSTGTEPAGPGSVGRSVGRIGRTPGNAAVSGTGSGIIERTRRGGTGLDGSETASATGAGGSSTGGAGSGGVGPGGSGLDRGSATGEVGGEGLIPRAIRSDIEGAIGKGGGKVPAAYRLRTSPARKKIALEMGANEESERAVEASLLWLANHQHPQGYWEPIESTLGVEPDPTIKFNNPQERQQSGFNSESGLTALAVLAFLGKGYTHEDNPFADNVERALRWLVSQQDSKGFLGGRANGYAKNYCHGMATIALGEAYGMTKDQTLREPLARAVEYIVDLQNADGGWRYFKGQQGDMSMFGWQLMALKSAKTAGLTVPQASMKRAIDFLISHGDDMKKRGLSQFGGLAGYRVDARERPKPSMTAEALFCKQILGITRTNRASIEAVDYLLKNLPQRSKQDLYYWYYGTLAMYHHGGESWRHWNQALRDNLVSDQRTDGDFAGSWNPRAPWGDYGGRVFSTALSTLCLEVYYRFLPLYQAEDAARIEQSGGK